MWKRKTAKEAPTRSKFSRFGRSDLIDLLEATMMRNGELFRGLSHSELDQEWVLAQLETQTQQQLEAIRALQAKVELQTF